jgi:hypothetical protein
VPLENLLGVDAIAGAKSAIKLRITKLVAMWIRRKEVIAAAGA